MGLPLALVLLTAAALGCYYETNDDVAITLLLRGRSAAAPVGDLHLYFHGWAALLAGLYARWPAAPWYGLLLYGLLTLALMLLFAVLDRLLRPHLGGVGRAGVLGWFYLAAGLEHVLWFNYMRVPLLLAGAALLFAAQRLNERRRWPLALALLSLLAAWAIRPSAALLGALVAAPAAYWLAGRRASRLLLLAALLFGAGTALLTAARSPEAARYRRLDVLKSNFSDYQLSRPRPRTAADSLGVRAVQEWVLGDSVLVDEALFARALPVEAAAFWQHTAPAKLRAGLPQFGRDYFLVLLLNLALLAWGLGQPGPGAWAWRLYLLAVPAGLLALLVLLKLPPRLALPILTIFTVANAAGVLGRAGRPVPGRYLLLTLLLASGLYAYKTAHRVGVLRAEQARNAGVMHALVRQAAGRTVVAAGLETHFKSLSPFVQYDGNGPGRWLLLTGWPTLDPSQPRLRQHLAGTRDQARALGRLLPRADVYAWWPAPGPLTRFLRRYGAARRWPAPAGPRDKNL